MCEKLKDYSDEELVSLSQKDIDKFRSQCIWECPKCGFSCTYDDSKEITESAYVHEMKCIMRDYDKKSSDYCGEKMVLNSTGEQSFHSSYFSELFGRYEGKIIKESIASASVDSFEEIYSCLTSVFTKVVGMFARDSSFKKTSNKWFSSFFWQSVKHRVIDIKKTNSYSKRSPSVQCECCHKFVGQITTKHLSTAGHQDIFERVLEKFGTHILKESGEDKYYNSHESLRSRAIIIGQMAYTNMEKKERKTLLNSEILKAYYDLYPNAYFKNRILSTNEKISEDSEVEVEDYNNNDVLGYHSNAYDDFVDQMSVRGIMDNIISIVFEEGDGLNLISNYFTEDLSDPEKIKIIKSVLIEKSISQKLKNTESDKSYSCVKDGFTSTVLKIVRENKKFKTFLNKEICI